MAAPAVAGGAVAAAGGFSLLAIPNHASDDQAYHSQQDSQNQYSSHNRVSFLRIGLLGAANRPQLLYEFTPWRSAYQLPCKDEPAYRS